MKYFLASFIFLFLGFADPIQDKLYHELINEIRCVTCPNQSIADSSAPIAVAMREDIARRIEAGESESVIREYLLLRYGEYITYRPIVQKETWALWWGPLIFMLIGLGLWLKTLHKRQE